MKPILAHVRPGTDRAKTWRRIFGGETVPIRSPIQERRVVPGGVVTEVYMVDVSQLGPVVLERLVDHIAERFDVPVAEVFEGVLGTEGLPILAEDVSVTFDARLFL